MALVVDASVILAWALDEPAAVNQPERLLQIAREGMMVPSIWAVEIANGFIQSLRRKRLTEHQLDQFLILLGEMQIEHDIPSHHRAFGGVLQVGIANGLTAYDASYVELAHRMGLRLVTVDKRMASVAQSLGVNLLQ